jgi:putative tricarboxylic transport membrane protein
MASSSIYTDDLPRGNVKVGSEEKCDRRASALTICAPAWRKSEISCNLEETSVKRIYLAAAAFIALCFGTIGAFGGTLSCANIRIIVPFSAGGATDLTARLISAPLGRALNTTVIIENKPGATGNMGTAYVAHTPANGCTLVVNVGAILTYQWVFRNLGYDPNQLIPIGGIGRSPSLILAPMSSKVTDLKMLVALSKKKPGGLTFATAGLGLMPHLGVEEIAHNTGAKFVAVFYKGAPDFMSDLTAGRVDFGSTAAANSMPFVRAGKLKALAVMQETRSPLAPNIPTTAEQGMSKLDASSLFVLFAPHGTPKAVIALLSSDLEKIVKTPDISARLQKAGFDPSPMNSEEAEAVVQKYGHDWEPIVKGLHLISK